jgi:hypothetical protein
VTQPLCPEHGIPDCSPLLNGCSRLVEQYTDRLLFRRTPEGRNEWLCGWMGPWPPPERMALITGRQTGQITALDLADPPPELASAVATGLFDLCEYRLHSASEIPERAPANENWFRGAVYVELS